MIEDTFKADPSLGRVLSNAMVIGDKRKFLSMLLCLKSEVAADGMPTNKLSKEVLQVGASFGSQAMTTEEAMVDPLWLDYLQQGVERANEKATSNAQRIQRWAILPLDFSEKGGELTPTLKLKRKAVLEKYAGVIDNLYDDAHYHNSNMRPTKRPALSTAVSSF